MRKVARKIFLLLWKNFLVQKRHPLQTVFELLIPIVMSAMLVALRYVVNVKKFPEPLIYQPFQIQNCTQHIFQTRWYLAWSPSTDREVTEIMNTFFNISDINVTGIPFESEEEMEAQLSHKGIMDGVIAGIAFDDDQPCNATECYDWSSIRKRVKIRFPGLSRIKLEESTTLDTQVPNWHTDLIFPLYQPFGPRDKFSPTGGEPGYCEEGFLVIQDLLFRSILSYYANGTEVYVPSYQFERFPYPPYEEDALLPALISFVSIIVVISYVYSAVRTIKLVTIEKETQMKDAMKLMGLCNWMHWCAWYVKEILQWILPSICITFLLTHEWPQGPVIKKTDPFLLFFILFVYSVASIAFCFLISVCFNRANSAATVGGALWFLQYSTYMIFQPSYLTMTWRQIVTCSLLSNTNMGYIMQILVMYEGAEEGLQWSNVFLPVTPTDKICLGELLIVLVIDAVIYSALAIYIETAFPGKYGLPQPWYFPFQATYWCGYKKSTYDTPCVKGIQIRNLSKKYPNGTAAVKDLTLDIYPNQITVLLGLNGAGKSTTMSMLTGLTKPTSGVAIIDGHDIWSETSKIQDSLGLCPQYNLLFAELTVREHLKFFGMLKGIFGTHLNEEISKYGKVLDMESKLDCQAHTLSGGYKRKLSVAIALVGQSKVVLLDEPTSGMDPTARRCLWDVLQSEREGRTMVLTTHMMDEADLLGDRVAIINNGELKCIGTPFSLKKKYGHGYTLTLVKQKNRAFKLERIIQFMHEYYPDCYPASNTESELKYVLDDVSNLARLLNALADEQKHLSIKEYGISLTTMEDVFMSVGAEQNAHDALQESGSNKSSLSSGIPSGNGNSSMFSLFHTKRSKRGLNLWLNQFHAMFVKKMLITWRSMFLYFLQLLITLLFLIIAIIVTRAWQESTNLLPLELSLNQYRDSITLISNNNSEIFEELYSTLIDTVEGRSEIIVHNYTGAASRTAKTMEQLLLDEYSKSVYKVNLRYPMGFVFGEDSITGYFNDQPYHSLPTTLNLLHNVLLKYWIHPQFNFSIINKPLPFMPWEAVAKLEGGGNLGFQVAFNVAFAQAFICGIFVLLCVKEKENGAKHLQFISGVNPLAYWLASTVWDYLAYLGPVATILLTLFAYQDPAFSETEQLGQIFLLMLAFTWAFVPLMSIFSYMFSTPSVAFMNVSFFNVITGSVMLMIVLIMEIRPLRLVEEAETIDGFMIVFPHYALANGLKNIYMSYDMAKACKMSIQYCGKWDGSHYSWENPGIGRNIAILYTVGAICQIILLSLEYLINRSEAIKSVLDKYWNNIRARPGMNNELKPSCDDYDETDVAMERYTVLKCADVPSEYNIIMKNVWKKYPNGVFAVKGLNLALRPFECFALLGSNGAGKSSTFQMLACKSSITAGSISICSMDVKREKSKVSQIIGYCPQFDALINHLTGYEILKMFCTLRGIPHSEHELVISQLCSRLILHKFLKVQVGSYSGGNKRKLSTAVAMIGDPPVLLLDEPTSGMDPEARRHLWNTINEEREKGKCILITTHSLEECEALCTRLAIMVEGAFRCIGSVQHLKSKYAAGYKIHVKFPPHSKPNVKWFVSASLPGSDVQEEYEGMILFSVPKCISCSKVFNVMEKAKTESLIEDYSIQQTSLEQVFLQLTK